jgi:hypothetical protein
LKFSLQVDFFSPDGSVHGFHVFDFLEFLRDLLHSGEFVVIGEGKLELGFVNFRLIIMRIVDESAIV